MQNCECAGQGSQCEALSHFNIKVALLNLFVGVELLSCSCIFVDLDASQTESEMERSMRDILPSEKQIKKLRQHGSLTNVGPAVDHSSGDQIFIYI